MPFVPDDAQSAAPVVVPKPVAPVAPIAPAPVVAVPTPPVAHTWDAPMSAAPAPTPAPASAASAPAPVAAAPVAKQSSFVPDPPAPWSIDWSKGGEVTLPQPVQDFGTVMGERASSGLLNAAAAWQNGTDLATQKAQLIDAASNRLGPKLSTLADTLGFYANPINLLAKFPGGQAASGAINEGLKSKLEGDDWTTAGERAVQGGLTGGAGEVLSRLAVAPQALSRVTDYGLSALGGGLSHLAFGDTVVPGLSIANAYATHHAIQPAIKWVEANAPRLAALQPHLGALLTGAGLSVPQTIQDLWKGTPQQ